MCVCVYSALRRHFLRRYWCVQGFKCRVSVTKVLKEWGQFHSGEMTKEVKVKVRLIK